MDFRYYMPVKIVCGRDCVRKNAPAFAEYGKKAFIVTGKSSSANGALADVTAALAENGQEWLVYDKIPPNPTVDCVREGGALARGFGADFVVAIGGGSPMDAAKAIAMLARQDAGENIFAYQASADVLPMLHVPTTAGTGSEVTPYAILTNDEKETKTSISNPAYFPKAAFLDGKYMLGLPRDTTVYTAIDAMSHAMEGMLSVRAGALTDALAKESLRVLRGELPALASGRLSEEDGHREHGYERGALHGVFAHLFSRSAARQGKRSAASRIFRGMRRKIARARKGDPERRRVFLSFGVCGGARAPARGEGEDLRRASACLCKEGFRK